MHKLAVRKGEKKKEKELIALKGMIPCFPFINFQIIKSLLHLS